MSIRDFTHPELGIVHVRVRANARHISARWRQGAIYLNVPPYISDRAVMDAFKSIVPRLAKCRPTKHYHDGQQLYFDGLTITIRRQTHQPNKIMVQAHTPLSAIEVGSSLRFDSDETTQAISKMICRIARVHASDILLPHAQQLAQYVGKKPIGWTISIGHKTLGRCSSKGIISLSYMNVFLPPHLRDYVIYHELAHLSEMSHSHKFHELCNRYCGGRERQYIKELHHFDWPVLR